MDIAPGKPQRLESMSDTGERNYGLLPGKIIKLLSGPAGAIQVVAGGVPGLARRGIGLCTTNNGGKREQRVGVETGVGRWQKTAEK